MYSVLINQMYYLELGADILVIVAFLFFVACGILLCVGLFEAPERFKALPLSFSLVSFVMFVSLVALTQSPVFDIKWQTARVIAPKVDEYIKSSPDTLLDATNIVKYGDRLVQDLSVTVLDYIKKGE